jgi:2-methylcitrate dehydratase PrpD
MRTETLSAQEIEQIVVYCSSFCHAHTARPYIPQDAGAAQMNIYFCLAIMALDRTVMMEQFTESRLCAPDVMQFIVRIQAHIDPRFDSMGHGFRLAARVCVRCKDGRNFEREVLRRPGSAENPLDGTRITSKFHALASQGLPESRAQILRKSTERLEQLSDVSELTDALG